MLACDRGGEAEGCGVGCLMDLGLGWWVRGGDELGLISLFLRIQLEPTNDVCR